MRPFFLSESEQSEVQVPARWGRRDRLLRSLCFHEWPREPKQRSHFFLQGQGHTSYAHPPAPPSKHTDPPGVPTPQEAPFRWSAFRAAGFMNREEHVGRSAKPRRLCGMGWSHPFSAAAAAMTIGPRRGSYLDSNRVNCGSNFETSLFEHHH